MTLVRSIRLQHLQVVSWFLVISGALSFAAGLALESGELWQLVGLMLVLAGGVKILMIFLWRQLAGLETDRHRPVPPT